MKIGFSRFIFIILIVWCIFGVSCAHYLSTAALITQLAFNNATIRALNWSLSIIYSTLRVHPFTYLMRFWEMSGLNIILGRFFKSRHYFIDLSLRIVALISLDRILVEQFLFLSHLIFLQLLLIVDVHLLKQLLGISFPLLLFQIALFVKHFVITLCILVNKLSKLKVLIFGSLLLLFSKLFHL